METLRKKVSRIFSSDLESENLLVKGSFLPMEFIAP